MPLQIKQAKLRRLEERFRGYRRAPNIGDIQRWLNYFGADVEIAIKVLDHVRLLDDATIQRNYADGLRKISGWQTNANDRRGNWYFAGYGSPAESGARMLHVFREALGMESEKFKRYFVAPSDLPQLELENSDTLIFIDDFSGTGDQISKGWKTTKELIGSEPRCFIILAAATIQAIRAIKKNTDLNPIVPVILKDDHNVFHTDCKVFTPKEKEKLLSFCERADANTPCGYGNCGLTLVLSHKTPNNSIPVLHVNKTQWRGLFPRRL